MDGWVDEQGTNVASTGLAATGTAPATPPISGDLSLVMARTAEVNPGLINYVFGAQDIMTVEFDVINVASTNLAGWYVNDAAGYRGPSFSISGGKLKAYNTAASLVNLDTSLVPNQLYNLKLIGKFLSRINRHRWSPCKDWKFIPDGIIVNRLNQLWWLRVKGMVVETLGGNF